jgi:hypothetical protein
MYGRLKKTTVYLPDDLKRRLERTAQEQHRAEAEVVRAALDEYMRRVGPRPTLPLFAAGEVAPVEDWEEAMRGFGEG